MGKKFLVQYMCMVSSNIEEKEDNIIITNILFSHVLCRLHPALHYIKWHCSNPKCSPCERSTKSGTDRIGLARQRIHPKESCIADGAARHRRSVTGV